MPRSPSEQNPESRLDLAVTVATQRAGDGPKGTIVHVSIWIAGVWSIRQVVKFTAERVSDYAVISNVRGLKSARRILLIGGVTTTGTAVAAPFVTFTAGY